MSRYQCPHCDEWMDSSKRVRHRPCPSLVRMLDVTHSRAVERVLELETAVHEVLEFLVVYGGGSGNTACVVEILAAVWPWDDQRVEVDYATARDMAMNDEFGEGKSDG